MKLKNSNGEKKLKNSKWDQIQIVKKKLKNPNYDKTKNSNCDKTEISNCDKT